MSNEEIVFVMFVCGDLGFVEHLNELGTTIALAERT